MKSTELSPSPPPKRFDRKRFVKITILAALGTFALLLIITAVLWFIDSHMKASNKKAYEESVKSPSFDFHEADYHEDIFQDVAYLSKNRSVAYKHYAVTYYNQDDFTEEALFITKALEYIIYGDANSYYSLFAKDYLKNADDIRDEFTMQKLYDTFMELVYFEETTQSGITYIYTDIKVEYRIKDNNGSFRTDIPPDDAVRPMVYRLLTVKSNDGTLIEIYDYMPFSMYNSGLYK